MNICPFLMNILPDPRHTSTIFWITHQCLKLDVWRREAELGLITFSSPVPFWDCNDLENTLKPYSNNFDEFGGNYEFISFATSEMVRRRGTEMRERRGSRETRLRLEGTSLNFQSRTTHWPPSSVTTLPSHIKSLEHVKFLQHLYVLNFIWILRTTTQEWRKDGLPPLFSVSGNLENMRVVYTACQRWDA